MTHPTRTVWAQRPASQLIPPQPDLMMPITLGDALNAGAFGGTATVHRITSKPYLYHAAKLFNDDVLASRRTAETHDKLRYIAASSDVLKRGYVLAGRLFRGRPHIAWPEALLYDAEKADPKHLVGFAMPLFSDSHPLSRLTSPKQRKIHFPDLPPDGLLLAASAIAGAVHDLHGADGRSGIVIGDLTPRNIMITAGLGCHLIDADSYQFTTSTRVYGSGDTTPGFRSPRIAEAAKAGKPLPAFLPADDAYCLAVVIFQVLVDGAHPFTAGERFEVGGVKPDEEDNLLAQRFVYADPGKYFPPKIRLQTYQKLAPEVRQAFEQAFTGTTPPSPGQWLEALARARADMSAPPHVARSAARPSVMAAAAP